MHDSQELLTALATWLRTLPDDARALGRIVADEAAPEDARIHLGGALNYLFKNLDLIPDGVADLGFLDDAFVLRESARTARSAYGELSDDHVVARLAADSDLVREILGADAPRLAAYVATLPTLTVRGRTGRVLVSDDGARAAFLVELSAWAEEYQLPRFEAEERTLVKLRSFLSTKLPPG